MLIKTLLNNCYHFKSFVYGACHLHRNENKLTVEIQPRKNSKPECPTCGRRCPQYDTQPSRKFEFIPLWGIRVFFEYRPRRVSCPKHGVVVEFMPWARGKSHSTIAHMLFLAEWARVLSWKEVSRRFKTHWHNVYEAVKYVVEWGMKQRDMTGITAIGVDEISVRKGHRYITLVYQINEHCKRLLWVVKEEMFAPWFGSSTILECREESRLSMCVQICGNLTSRLLRVGYLRLYIFWTGFTLCRKSIKVLMKFGQQNIVSSKPLVKNLS